MDVPKPRRHFAMDHRRWIIAVGILFAIAAMLGWLLLRGDEPERRVELVVERQAIDFPIEALGSLQPRSVVVLALEVDGTVRTISASPGDRVAKGQRIAVLANERLLADAEAARSRFLQAEAQHTVAEATAEAQAVDEQAAFARSKAALRFAESEHAARRASFEKGVISRLSLEESLARLEMAKADHRAAQLRLATGERLRNARVAVEAEARRSAEDSLERLRYLSSRLTITAPVAGVLSALELEVGQALVAGTKIGRVIEPKGFIALVRVPEDLAPMIGVGTPARLDVGSEVLGGSVARVNPVVDQGFRSVEIAIEDDLSKLGAFADQTSLRATLRARAEDGTLSIPYQPGIRPGQRVRMVAVSQGAQGETRDIVLGARLGDRIVVRSGAVQGERLLLVLDPVEGATP